MKPISASAPHPIPYALGSLRNAPNHHRFIKMLLLAVALHGALLLWLDFHPSHGKVKKMMAPLFEVSEPQMSAITVNLTSGELEAKPSPTVLPSPTALPKLRLNKEKPLPTKTDEMKNALSSFPVMQAQSRKRTISAAAHRTQDATYLARWQTYIESFGNEHYPDIALKNNLKGDLRLLVAINRDGSIHEVSLRQSSGSPLLDQAAMNIVLAAAPFEPLPPEIAVDTEVLEIIRTWQFRGKLHTSH